MSSVVLRTQESEICRIACGPRLREFAMRWNYVVRQRHRWADDPDARHRQSLRLQSDLRRLGVTTRQMRRLRGVVQVSVPPSRIDEYWESRILPWEYVLAAASKSYRGDDPILVVRHLRTGRRKPRRIPKQVMVIETAPGELSRHFHFPAPQQLVAGALRDLPAQSLSMLSNPTASELAEQVAVQSPDLIHVSGFDIRSARELLGLDPSGARDGLCLADASSSPMEYRAERIAELLNQSDSKPLLIGLHCWDSAARLAPMTIAAGTAAVIGFQHTFDEAVAEVFFLNFYRECVRLKWDLLAAFQSAWDSISEYRPRIRGSCIVLWAADSLLTRRLTIRSDESSVSVTKPSAGMKPAVTRIRTADPQRDRIGDLLQATVRPKSRLNYSLLHNGESVFDQLTLRFNPQATDAWSAASASLENVHRPREVISGVEDLDLEVQLNVGADSYPYRTRIQLSAHNYRYDLANQVSLPLNSELFRTITERIQTSLFVDLRWHDQVLYRHTHRVWLAPIDQWTLEEQQIGWLPSFVQPRDPEVLQTIGRAQCYLQCLTDRIGVGFDGYQSYDALATGLARWDGVDRQVRSIWSSLLLNTPLRYINPPPSYAAFTQRLRTPGDTISGGFGTCVDLAILMASCLEWIEIHPVLILLEGHVFCGYWKDLSAHQRFREVLTDDLPGRPDEAETAEEAQSPRWLSGRKTYTEIKGYIDRGELVPIETVALTDGKGFANAVDEGRLHFYKQRNRLFRAMIDLVSARQDDAVTPLPLRFSDTPSGYR